MTARFISSPRFASRGYGRHHPLAIPRVSLAHRLAEAHPNVYVQQLSTNGIFAFAYAYRHNEIDYERYYPTLPVKQLDRRIRMLVSEPNSTFVSSHGLERQVSSTRTMRPVNVVLVSVESLSAEYLGHFGNDAGLTPNLDALAERGLLFTDLYATGITDYRLESQR